MPAIHISPETAAELRRLGSIVCPGKTRCNFDDVIQHLLQAERHFPQVTFGLARRKA